MLADKTPARSLFVTQRNDIAIDFTINHMTDSLAERLSILYTGKLVQLFPIPTSQ